MQKLIYWIGVYAICTTVHDILDYSGEEFVKKSYRRMRKYIDTNKEKKGPIGITPEPARKPINRIGFGERD